MERPIGNSGFEQLVPLKGFSDAGFIRRDGTLVGSPEREDFRHHNALGGTLKVMASLRAGVIRYRPKGPLSKETNIELGAEPTPEQCETIKKIVEQEHGPVRIEVAKNESEFGVINWTPEGTTEAAVADIRRFYAPQNVN